MSALRKPELSGDLTGEIARLWGAGFSLLPLGGKDGKSPLCKLTASERLPLARVFAPMHRAGSSSFGIRLDGLAVIDCDSDDPSLIRELEARFGASPLQVRTPRGRHLWYRSGKISPNLRSEGLPVDVKCGAASYVVGPPSIRPDGGSYVSVMGLLGKCELPWFHDRSGKQAAPLVQAGSRNLWLVKEAIGMVEVVDGVDELFGNLLFCRDERCERPETLADAEVQRIATWAWSRRLEGKIYRGRNSEFRLHRNALDALRALPNSSDAIALFVVLSDLHGHLPAKPFALDWQGMRGAGLTDLSERRFFTARRALESAGILSVASKHRTGKCHRTYRLNRVRDQAAIAPNVTRIVAHQQRKGGRV